MDPYLVLGVPSDATVDEIHDAYRRLARQAHPDAGAVDDSEMARLNEAWRLLRDPSTRATFDASRRVDETSEPNSWGNDSDAGGNLDRRVRVMIVTVAVASVLVFVAIFLIGFGRLGAPSP